MKMKDLGTLFNVTYFSTCFCLSNQITVSNLLFGYNENRNKIHEDIFSLLIERRFKEFFLSFAIQY